MPPCPHRREFEACAYAMMETLPEFLAKVGLAEKVELTIVLTSKVCDCVVCMAPDSTTARRAAEELAGAAERKEARAQAAKDGN
jgi:alkylhydroperoxidase family enzyme